MRIQFLLWQIVGTLFSQVQVAAFFVWKRAKLVNTYIDPAHIEEDAEGNKKVPLTFNPSILLTL